MDFKKFLCAKCASIGPNRAQWRGYTYAVLQIYVKWNYLRPSLFVVLYMKDMICAYNDRYRAVSLIIDTTDSIATMLRYV